MSAKQYAYIIFDERGEMVEVWRLDPGDDVKAEEERLEKRAEEMGPGHRVARYVAPASN